MASGTVKRAIQTVHHEIFMTSNKIEVSKGGLITYLLTDWGYHHNHCYCCQSLSSSSSASLTSSSWSPLFICHKKNLSSTLSCTLIRLGKTRKLIVGSQAQSVDLKLNIFSSGATCVPFSKYTPSIALHCQSHFQSLSCPQLGVKIVETVGMRLLYNLWALTLIIFLLYNYQYSWKLYMRMCKGALNNTKLIVIVQISICLWFLYHSKNLSKTDCT